MNAPGPGSVVAAPRDILTPSQLAALTRDLLEGSFPLVWVEGEIGNLSRPASGHLYLTLKDARAQLRCAMFKPKSQRLGFRPADGMQVLVRGRLTLYDARGDLQLVLDHMEPAGEGELRRAFDELKARLASEGLFDAQRKRALPRHIRRLGVITSPSGAAVRDVLSVLARRFPLLDVDVLPVPVQGAASAPAIVATLRGAGASARYDALLLTRGGGSLEDLWSFNDETLVRAIVASPVPVVSAVGHEVDFTLADFAADLRAPTPSAAAELLVPDRIELIAALAARRQRLDAGMRRRHDALAQRLDNAWLRLHALRPQVRLDRGAARLSDLRHRLGMQLRSPLARRGERLRDLVARLHMRHPQAALHQARTGIRTVAATLQRDTLDALAQRRLRLAGLGRALNAVSPLATLERGYAILLDPASGRVIRSTADAAPGQRVDARLVDGTLPLRVDSPGK
jgi:exodeoxyribonuclease VII large subunit